MTGLKKTSVKFITQMQGCSNITESFNLHIQDKRKPYDQTNRSNPTPVTDALNNLAMKGLSLT